MFPQQLLIRNNGAIMNLQDFTNSYKVCALWTEEEQLGIDDANIHDSIDPDTAFRMEEDCRRFVENASTLLHDWTAEQAGHDFWLTRNGHGAGFWDKDISTEENRTALTELSKAFGEYSIYANDNQVHGE
jgi:hypothetical protein